FVLARLPRIQRQAEVMDLEGRQDALLDRLREGHLVDDWAELGPEHRALVLIVADVTVLAALRRGREAETEPAARLQDRGHFGCADAVTFVGDEEQPIADAGLLDQPR